MSDQFYRYLAKNLVKYFESREIKSGDKFNIQFEREEQVKIMYDVLEKESNSRPFTYNIMNGSKYKTFSMNVSGIQLIVASNNNTTNDFLIRLRNLIGNVASDEFKDSAILFIHNMTLDSLIRGTESLQKEGMPFHTKTLVKDIQNKLENDKLKEDIKHILYFVLDRMNKSILEDNSSIFQYENILDILNKGRIEKSEYSKFGLFYDDNMLDNKSSKAIKERLLDNEKLFSIVNSIHQYGDPKLELEKHFDSKGIDLLKDENWKYSTYKDIKSSQERMKNKKVELLCIECVENLKLWSKPDIENKSKRKNILLFNKDKLDIINLCIKFDKKIEKTSFSIDKMSKTYTEVKASGNKAYISININISETTFTKVKYNDGIIKYEFRICIVSCDENILNDIKSNYGIVINSKRSMLVTNTDDDTIVINPKGIIERKIQIDEFENEINLEEGERLDLELNVELEEDVEFIKIDVVYDQSVITIVKQEEKEQPISISGMKTWKLKRERKESFKYLGNSKIVQGTSEYFPKENFKENLQIEEYIIENNIMHCTILEEKYKIIELDVDSRIKEAYKNLISYYKVNDCIPSLAYYDVDLVNISKNYINTILEVFEDIKNGKVLSKERLNIAKVGTIHRIDKEEELFLTPLHPVNVAYQLMINNVIGDEEVKEGILKLLGSKYLMPYIYKGKNSLYKVVDQRHSPEWTYYVDHDMSRYKGSRDYVSKLTKEKINEFIEHFTYLFRNISKSVMKIKLINLGDCKEVLLGIFDYYVKKLGKGEEINNLISIDIYIYGDKSIINSFEEIAFYNSINDIKKHFNVNLSVDNYSEEDVLNLFRDKVKFYKKDKMSDLYEYSHLTLYQMDKDVNITSSSMGDIKTGVSLNGLVAGVPSIYLEDTYRTGFGSKFMATTKNELLNISMKFNSLTKSIGTGDPFNDNLSVTTSISENNSSFLNKIYKTSHWVTFIDPKVDLNFFKDDENSNDLLIIHYSDQYTTSSGYDAITVTRKSEQYKFIIEEFLNSKDIKVEEDTVPNLINYFNAINGDWLLRLISSKSQFPREKLSILSAIKISLAYFYHPNIIWIPISLEEILRVSGGAGLKQAGGPFTVKKLTGDTGSYSDDLLLVGIENKNNKIKVYFYPVEVKIGDNNESVIKKAIIQANKTRDLIEEYLTESENDSQKFTKLMYRNFMIQLAIVSAQKMKLYHIWDEQNWDDIINSDIRTNLLNDNYEISNDLDEFIGRGAVISFKKGTYYNGNLGKEDNITILNLSEQEGYNNIVMDLEEMKEKYIRGKSDFVIQEMLINKYLDNTIGIQNMGKNVILDPDAKLNKTKDYD
ncbi:DNA phosphorothioation-dependent restriction protein DptH [Clostridioides difficile]|uniref:DNA phosphorothioation-dependent restriction protein DptH n=1 Tax=Clostridioides difficile TaxID=1496 RepID=UPI001C1CE165|nr:DNA phosphorothioation-dependent restriction protein DptH [Clostridioides difficile]MDF3815469.1 DNA phosphorothioation-dependent restriction protein DptH [Clostridioides difficile]HBF4286144.1 DNA phosphorothioation-dependent restriction protein DptH [Clostridioides difficile]HBF5050273.1 DNA phosphorothioation-dependent restriction protein DptH [Clostridioides difficile]HBF5115876.1 DNA phosphorothioation-dependent restriction protein DptH [Clostridioides difficile]HBF5878495.1 DNA phosph